MIFQLAYKSKIGNNLLSEEIDKILAHSKRNNYLVEISGCLVFFEKRFYQILEGEESVVRMLYDKIQLDKRHHAVEKLSEENTNTRLFSDWGMMYYSPVDTEDSEIGMGQFKRNIFLLSGLMNVKSKTELEFWTSVKNNIY